MFQFKGVTLHFDIFRARPLSPPDFSIIRARSRSILRRVESISASSATVGGSISRAEEDDIDIETDPILNLNTVQMIMSQTTTDS